MDNSSPDDTVKSAPAQSQPGETSGEWQPSHASFRDTAPAATPPRSPELLPSVALPKGSGAVCDMGEKLTANAAPGTLTVLLASGPGWASLGRN